MKRFLLTFCSVAMLLFLVGCQKEEVKEMEGNVETKAYYTAEDYLENPDLFVPVWADEREVPKEMLDFEEKYEAFFTPNGRLMCSIHRGDHTYYPENSTEGFLSAILMGADIVEVDVAMTKDGIPIVLHDDTLTRTTNVQSLRAKGTPGIPKSDASEDWTLDQIRRLRLLTNDTQEVTNYVVPTLEDVIMICNGRCFITLDKSSKFGWYQDIVPILEKHNAWRTVMLPYSYTYGMTFDRVKTMMDDIKERSGGYTSALMSRSYDITHLERISKLIDEYGFPKVIRCGEYDFEETEAYAPYFNNYRIHIECLYGNDYLMAWKRIHGAGFNLIVSNDPMGITSYIQELYFE